MSTATATLKMLLLGEDRTASSVLKRVGGQADDTGKKVGGMSTKSKVALLAVAGAATAFASSSVSKFKQVGSETLGLQRVLGGTTEDASRLRFAASQTGVSYESFAKSTGKLSKTLAAAEGSTKSNAAMIKTLGFNYRDASGHLLPMYQLLPKLEDKFSKMQAGPEKTALAMKLFGKAGTEMLPFLNKGSVGIAALSKESDKFGLTLTGKNIDALKKSKASQREWNASMDGLKVQIGAQLLPVINTFVVFLREHIIPLVTKLTGFIQQHKNAVMIAVVAIGAIVVAMKAWAIIQKILNYEFKDNAIGLIIAGIAALAAGLIYAYQHSATFRAIVQGALHAVVAAATAVANFFTKDIPAAFSSVVAFVKNWGPMVLAVLVPFIGIPLLIWQHWSQIKAFMVRVWNTVWPYLKTWGPVALAVLVPFIGIPLLIFQHFNQIVGFLRRVWNTVYGDVKGFVGNVVGWITGLPGKIAAIAGRMASAGRSLLSAWWDGIKSAASGAAHFVGNIISSMANAIKNAINDILHLPWRLPDIKIGAFGHYVHVGGQTLFPRLREGGMTTGPGIFMMGDNPSGREVALPLDSPHTTRALGKALGAAGASGGGNLTVQVTFPGGTLIGSPVELGKAVKIGVEAAVNQGVKFNISQGIR